LVVDILGYGERSQPKDDRDHPQRDPRTEQRREISEPYWEHGRRIGTHGQNCKNSRMGVPPSARFLDGSLGMDFSGMIRYITTPSSSQRERDL
ncbi:MAG TPA: hypothetical protein VN039_11300, partial [Nitrospira sp.]|nr:hypothetical protein [Nitrospira sp.]